ncbi:arginine--tRNA ligase [Paulownia witches'-broom phytoplasma]|uniref:Arginine--tRNA ligase n=1 Tax=Paulownia witches'-broom phytoplasma TaxID=39647 RepID=A0ABX8TPV6_9MOLU|nr:arginine--tRNA ligase [Paulownia witches'-broom phytoplasma]QYC31140.1 arginine--tRNA ligase [Paulownia witches'-broom phytoplasma]GLH60355.1 arginine--tRNA ligase 1 [Paulownia witches'-broom phytoplasma]
MNLQTTKSKIQNAIQKVLLEELILQEQLENDKFDFSLPLFAYAKKTKTNPHIIFENIKKNLVTINEIQELMFLNGFLNIKLKRASLAYEILLKINELQANYGNFPNQNQIIVIDYSSPNIAKNFSVGHLRSTIIGNALKNIYQKLGFEVVGINHLGDWGTQFGKMIVAYQKWGNKEKILKDPINELQKLYVFFHQQAKTNPELNEQANFAFLQLEQQNQKYLDLWKWFREVSLQEFCKIYDILGISFDFFLGESFYNDKIAPLFEELEQKKLLKEEDQVLLIELDNLPPGLVKKTNGSTLYLTRDLTTFKYRFNTFNCQNVLYVVGNEQKLYFKQLAQIIEKMGYCDTKIKHINFGLVLMDGKKISTRHHKFTTLIEVINQATILAQKIIEEKNPHLSNLNQIARKIAVGAIIFNDLKNDRHLDIDFNLETILQFKGQTGPYLQYTAARLNSLLNKEKLDTNLIDKTIYQKDHYFILVKLLDQFPLILQKAKKDNMPSILARYMLKITQNVNFLYSQEKILTDDKTTTNTNLLLIQAVFITLKESLRILGVPFLENM